MIPTMPKASFKDRLLAELIYQRSNADSMLSDYEMMNQTNTKGYVETTGYYNAIQNLLDFIQESDNINTSTH